MTEAGSPDRSFWVVRSADWALEQLSALGINGVWLHVVLRDLAPGGAAFPGFGAGHEKRLTNLLALVQRAKMHGIALYLYLNEPRAMPAGFFQNRPDMAGVRAFMRRARLTPTGWARSAGVTPGEILAFLSGHARSIAPETLAKLARAADTSVEALFR